MLESVAEPGLKSTYDEVTATNYKYTHKYA
jgi:hypothetical protein